MFVSILFIYLLNNYFILSVKTKIWCPPKNFAVSSKLTKVGFTTALITEIHGGVGVYTRGPNSLVGPHFASFYSGHRLSHNILHHVGMLGIDKVFITVMYNDTIFKTPPTVEDIYPSSNYCVGDWVRLGVVDWRPVAYLSGPQTSWPKDNFGQPSMDRDAYKTILGINPIYKEIRNNFDWVFVLDTDELLVPINYHVPRLDWCTRNSSSLVSRCLEHMLITATSRLLEDYEVMSKFREDRATPSSSCSLGHGRCHASPTGCAPITAFSLPTHLWLKSGNESSVFTPVHRTKYPTSYAFRVNTAEDNQGITDRQPRTWKSVYQTKYNPLLEGRSLHDNPAKDTFPLLAPRVYHEGTSLEIAHLRGGALDFSVHMIKDTRLKFLTQSYFTCMRK